MRTATPASLLLPLPISTARWSPRATPISRFFDFMSMPHWLTEQHQMIRDSVRRFAESEIAPISQRLWQEEEFPYDIWRKACRLGFTGLPYPEAYGGGGGEWLSFVIVLEELARVDCAVANSLMANSTV